MQKITLVAAMTAKRVIGKDNDLPWRLKQDLQHFKRYTCGKPLIMGRKTFESLGNKPLAGRRHAILSRSLATGEGYETAATLTEALALYPDDAEIIIAGGASVYQEALPLATHLVISWLNLSIDGDRFFPAVDWSNYQMTMQSSYLDQSPSFTINHYQRIDLSMHSQ